MGLVMEFDTDGLMQDVDEFEEECRRQLDQIGSEADEVDKEMGTYHDVTGRLRRSNKHRVTEDLTLELYNDAPYASDIEARGDHVRTDGYLYADGKINELFGR